MAEPSELPTLDEWNAAQLGKAILLAEHTPSGVRCPKSDTELLDVPQSTSAAMIGGLLITTVAVVCPDDGFTGVRYL